MGEKPKVYVFTGSRRWRSVASVLRITNRLPPGAEVHVGDCPTGLDAIVREHLPEARVHVADWDAHGRAAGPIRNGEMLEAAGNLAVVMAFPGRVKKGQRSGTMDCVRQAVERGMRVNIYP